MKPLIDLIRSQAKPMADAELPQMSGRYVLVGDPDAMRALNLRAGSSDRALYVGQAHDSIRTRVAGTHLAKNRTGSSTLRRSMGALLRRHLDLAPQPRSSKPTDAERCTHYRFDDAGERRLTAWIAANVRAWWTPPLYGDLGMVERSLIQLLHPVLNLADLEDWTNPHKRWIKYARAECACLARAAARGRRET